LAPRSSSPSWDPIKLGWATGELGLACYAAISTVYLLYYATQVLRIPPMWAGAALLVPRIWNIVGDPIVGVISDRTRSRFGRRRPYLVVGAIVWGGAFCLLLSLSGSDSPLTTGLIFSGVFLLNNTGLTVYQVPYTAMVAEMTRDPRERTELVAYKEIAARVGVLGALVLAPRILASAESPITGFRTIGAVFGGLIIASGIVAFFATARARSTASVAKHLSFTTQFNALRDNRPFVFVTSAFLFVNMGDAVFAGSLVYYVTEVLHWNASVIGALYPVSSVAGIVAAPIWATAANRWGKAAVCRVALAGLTICCTLPLLFSANGSWLMYPFMALYGLFNTGSRLLPNAMVPDTVEIDQKRTGDRREGAMFGAFVFVQQSGFAVGGFVLSLLLTLADIHGAQPISPAHRLTGVALCFTVAASLLYGMAFMSIIGYAPNVGTDSLSKPEDENGGAPYGH
jgi:glycoside/pentoside/hexuronide:cation symporter, GPH family